MLFIQSSLESAFGLPEWVGYIFVFVLGLAIGSFLNVVIHRVPREESVVFPNSACPNCGGGIGFYDNIPVISWLALKGKCRKCKTPIAWRYPAVELLTGLTFLLVYSQIGFNAFLPACLIFAAIMLSLIFIDAEHMILPNVITYPLLVFALLVRIIYPIFFREDFFTDLSRFPATYFAGNPDWLLSLISAALGAIVGGGSLWLVGELWKRFRGVDAMGLGDVKMMLGVGAFLGWQLTLLSIFLGAFSGALIGIAAIAKQKDKNLQTQLPFGIFLGLGSLISLLFGERLLTWYLSTFT